LSLLLATCLLLRQLLSSKHPASPICLLLSTLTLSLASHLLLLHFVLLPRLVSTQV
jgi:hypothetical protein